MVGWSVMEGTHAHEMIGEVVDAPLDMFKVAAALGLPVCIGEVCEPLPVFAVKNAIDESLVLLRRVLLICLCVQHVHRGEATDV